MKSGKKSKDKKKMNGIHNNMDFQLQNGLFNSSGNVTNVKINELNINAAMAAILASENNQSMLNGLADGSLNLFNSTQSSLNNPFYNYLHSNVFTNNIESNQSNQSNNQESGTPAMMIQNGLSNGTSNGFDKINSLFKPINGMLGE